MANVLRATHSVCPVCLKRLAADYVRRDAVVYLDRTCPEHGSFSTPVWRGEPDFLTWCGDWPDATGENPECPTRCGLCGKHQNKTCCAILDITQRCDLGCPVCFAAAGDGEDMPVSQVFESLEDMYGRGVRYLHLSGGEPTMHPQLPLIVSHAAWLGYEYIQLNTNGLRLAEDGEYVRALDRAGLSSVFLQFDGVSDGVYTRIRGRPLLEKKQRAIANCDAAQLGVVLVPTVIPGVNDGELGRILRFGFDNMPAVKGVHFQPITYVGRFDDGEKPRFTMPELLRGIEEQSGGALRAEWFSPSACDSPLCGFHGEFKRQGDVLTPLTGGKKSCCCGSGVGGNQTHVKNRWTRLKRGQCDPGSMDAFLLDSNEKSFCVSAMAFMDRETFDMGRLMRCSVHVYRDGKLIPFCAYHNIHSEQYHNLTMEADT